MSHDSRYGEECSHGHGWYLFDDGCAVTGCENAPSVGGGVPEQGLRDLQREMATPEGVERIKAELARGFASAARMTAAMQKARKVRAEFLRRGVTI